MVISLAVDDTILLKKQHPCGSRKWRIERLGADIGIRCLGCNRYLLLDRADLERRIRTVSTDRENGHKHLIDTLSDPDYNPGRGRKKGRTNAGNGD